MYFKYLIFVGKVNLLIIIALVKITSIKYIFEIIYEPFLLYCIFKNMLVRCTRIFKTKHL